MTTLFGIGFAAPWLLASLLALPVLWLVLRAVPPAPLKRRFPGVALLLGLGDETRQTARTPWWLLLLRTLAVAALIAGFAGPVLNPERGTSGSGPLLILFDGGWASAQDWDRRRARAETALERASQDGRPAAVLVLADPPAGGATFQAADAWLPRLAGMAPRPWPPVFDPSVLPDAAHDTLWLTDGLDHRGRAALLDRLTSAGRVIVYAGRPASAGLTPARFADGRITLAAVRADPAETETRLVYAVGTDPRGNVRRLESAPAAFAAGETRAEVSFDFPSELRNRISRFELDGIRAAGGVTLADDLIRRREIAVIGDRADREGLRLLSANHYLENALEPTADLIGGATGDILDANPDVIILADVAAMNDATTAAIADWVRAGGVLVRFAGPRLAASDLGRAGVDLLMPVRLRAGGRTVGGAMSWGEPKALRPFAETSPFFGLPLPGDIRVNAQVLAQPDPDLADRVIASLADGTPLVTRKPLGAGQIILFHVTANAEWSNLPLSGLFVQMLERLAVISGVAGPDRAGLAGTTWVPERLLTANGRVEAVDSMPGISGEDLAAASPGAATPPGVYAGGDRKLALNVLGADATLTRFNWPGSVTVEGATTSAARDLKGLLLAAAMALLAVDLLAALWLSGRLRAGHAVAAPLAALLLATAPADLRAQETGDTFALNATSEVVLAHVVTRDAEVDRIARAGLDGLSRVLLARTSVEPGAPVAVDIETDELAFFPFLYWPVTESQPIPSDRAYARLNDYLRTGGLILFDTRDADIARFGATTPEARKLQQLAAPLDIPPLEPLPPDHVLTRTFYLLQDFPGRFASRDIWVEAARANAEQVEGMPFRNLNDNVTPVIVGGNDWAAAWALDDNGNPMLPVGRGFAGDRQRELAFRFGVNLVMHVFTGNYKSDQVHVPALLDRLGQ